MPNFYIKTLGCKTNQLENEIIINNLSSLGYKQVETPEVADFYIVNSCAVTETSASESVYYLKNIKRKFPNIKTVLTGCVAQLGEQKKCEYIDYIIGNNEKLSMGEFLNQESTVFYDDIFKLKKFNHRLIHSNSRTRGNLKIQDGCNNRCSYCTIPFARGNSRSNAVENIIEQIKIFEKNAINEIILTGIHIGQWGLDFEPQQTLLDLLKEIEKTKIKRYRLGSLDPLEISAEMLEFLKNSEKFCPHFHVSIQSLSNKILKLMNRKYSAEFVLEKLQKIDETFNLPYLGCDLIVGFPDETEENFLETFENVKKSCLTKIHVFPYSIRKNTTAACMQNQVEEKTKKERAKILKTVASKKFDTFLNKNIGIIHEIQFNKKIDKKTGKFKGITKNYLNVLVSSENDITNQIKKIRIIEKQNENLIGKIE